MVALCGSFTRSVDGAKLVGRHQYAKGRGHHSADRRPGCQRCSGRGPSGADSEFKRGIPGPLERTERRNDPDGKGIQREADAKLGSIHRTDEITYIDAVHFPYWDTATATTAVAQIPPQRVEPILRDAKELRDQLREEAVQRHQTQRLGLIALLALPLAAFVVILLVGIWHALPTRADLRMKRSVRDDASPAGYYPSFQNGDERPLAYAVLSNRHASLNLERTQHCVRKN